MKNLPVNRKGVKVTQLVSKAKKESRQEKGERTFQIDGLSGYFKVGVINENKYNLTYYIKHPNTVAGNEKARFQVYDNIDKSKIYATNFDKVAELVFKDCGLKVYCYNEIAKKQAKQATVVHTNKPSIAKTTRLNKVGNLLGRIISRIRYTAFQLGAAISM